MFKATELERKIREINLFMKIQINLCSCKTSDHYLLLPLQRLSLGLLETKNVYLPMHKMFGR